MEANKIAREYFLRQNIWGPGWPIAQFVLDVDAQMANQGMWLPQRTTQCKRDVLDGCNRIAVVIGSGVRRIEILINVSREETGQRMPVNSLDQDRIPSSFDRMEQVRIPSVV